MSDYIENLKWRYATKQFDASKDISEEDLNYLKEALQLSASSYGLQPYEILIIKDQAIREKLNPAAWNQSQITDASYLIVFANKTDFGDELVDDYIDNVATTRNLGKEDLKGYADFMKSKLVALPQEEKSQWTAKQTYIALGNLLSAAAHKKLDVCPMEGFSAEEFNNILNLNDKNLNVSVIATVGHRSEEDATQHYAKVRKPQNILFKHV